MPMVESDPILLGIRGYPPEMPHPFFKTRPLFKGSWTTAFLQNFAPLDSYEISAGRTSKRDPFPQIIQGNLGQPSLKQLFFFQIPIRSMYGIFT